MSSQDPVVLTRAAVARAVKSGDHDAETSARRDYAAEKLAAYIRRTVDAAPPLSDEQRARLAHLLRPASVEDGHCCGSYGVDQLAQGIGCPRHRTKPL